LKVETPGAETEILRALRNFFARGRQRFKVLHSLEPSARFPSEAEILYELDPYIRRELILARMGTAQFFAAFPLPRSVKQYMAELEKDLDKVNAEIARRDLANLKTGPK
jgi:hypothetical protein